MIKEKYDEKQDTDKYMFIATNCMFLQMNSRDGIKRYCKN